MKEKRKKSTASVILGCDTFWILLDNLETNSCAVTPSKDISIQHCSGDISEKNTKTFAL